jgi:uncharacterized protein (DUF1330 family)
MPAYVIFIRERTLDQSELDAYAKAARPSLEGSPVIFLAAYDRQVVLEGPAPEGVAIAEFPSLEEAKQWYEAPHIKRRYGIDSKARPIAASLLKAFSSERPAQESVTCSAI